MSRGKRYDGEPKLNMKKVIATILVILVLVMAVFLAIRALKNGENKVESKIISTSYKTVYTDGKWGVINSRGEIVIKATYDDMIIIPDETKAMFVCQTDVDLDKGTYTSTVLNDKGEKQFPTYDNVEAIQDIDNNGLVTYYDNTLKVSKNGKYGLINFLGKELLPCEYDSIEPILSIENSLITSKEGKKGLVDKSGNTIIENNYADIQALTDKYEDGYIVKNDSSQYGLINYNKKQVLECKYKEIKHVCGSNLYIAVEDDNIELLNSDGEALLKNKFQDAVSIDNENIIIKENNHYGIMNKTGELKIKPDYDSLKYLFDGNYVAKKDDACGIIDLNGNIVLDFNYSDIIYMSEEGFIEAKDKNGTTNVMNTQFQTKCTGVVAEINTKYNYIKIRENGEYKYYNFKLEEKTPKDIYPANTLYLSKENGKYGYVNKNGIVVVNYIYDEATEQNEYGYSAVKKDGKWGAIDSTGKVVVEPQYELTQNPIVSFIAKWHLAPDLNANYYTNTNE